MEIAVLGVGRMGLNLARYLAGLGHKVRVSNGKDPATLRERLAALPPSVEPTDTASAVRAADIVFLAIMWADRAAAISAAGPNAFSGKIVVDLTNPYLPQGGTYVVEDLGGRPSSEVIAALVPGARVVKAFNTLNWEPLGREAHHGRGDERIAVPVAGDDDEAKVLVSSLIDKIGFAPIDAGTIAGSRLRQEPGQPLYNRNLTGVEARAELQRLTERGA